MDSLLTSFERCLQLELFYIFAHNEEFDDLEIWSEKTSDAETDINQKGGMHLTTTDTPLSSQTLRCIYLIFEMFQLKRKDSFQSSAGLISPQAAWEWNLGLALSSLKWILALLSKKFNVDRYFETGIRSRSDAFVNHQLSSFPIFLQICVNICTQWMWCIFPGVWTVCNFFSTSYHPFVRGYLVICCLVRPFWTGSGLSQYLQSQLARTKNKYHFLVTHIQTQTIDLRSEHWHVFLVLLSSSGLRSRSNSMLKTQTGAIQFNFLVQPINRLCKILKWLLK